MVKQGCTFLFMVQILSHSCTVTFLEAPWDRMKSLRADTCMPRRMTPCRQRQCDSSVPTCSINTKQQIRRSDTGQSNMSCLASLGPIWHAFSTRCSHEVNDDSNHYNDDNANNNSWHTFLVNRRHMRKMQVSFHIILRRMDEVVQPCEYQTAL